jgi:hypothetical protein
MSTKANTEDLTVKLTQKTVAMVLQTFTQFLKNASRQCSVRLVSIKVEFMAFCSMRIGNCAYKNCSMQCMMMQIIGWNFVSGFCTCTEKEYFPDFVVWSV